MTTNAFSPAPTYTISGTGPYDVPFDYGANEDIAVWILVGGSPVAVDEAEYMVVPEGPAAAGTVFLTPAYATAQDGETLMIARNTAIDQSWAGLGSTASSLESQLDQMTRAIQESQLESARSLRVLSPAVAPYLPSDGAVPYWDSAASGFSNGLSQSDLVAARDKADTVEAAIAGGIWRGNAAALQSDSTLTYTAGLKESVAAGQRIKTQTEGFAYQVAAAGASDHDATTAGGVKLYVLPQGGKIWDRQFFDLADDAARLNRAIQKAMALTSAGSLCKVMVQGLYTLNSPLKAFKFDGSAYSFTSVHIEAPAQGYVSNQRTTFKFTDGQNPGIVTQKVRQLTLKNIAIIGAANNLLLPSYADLLDRNGWWNANGAVESGAFKLHTGILVDPFYSAQSAGEKFSYFDGTGSEPNHYVAPSGDGSTQILVQNCDIQGWVCGIHTSGSPVQIGDSITVDKCNLSYNGYPVIIGESQNRGIHITDCHAKGFDVFLGTGSGYGVGTGSGGFINGGVFVYGYAMVNMDTSRGNGALTNVYAESIWSLGNVTGIKGLQFNNCTMKLIRDHNGRGVSTVLGGGGLVSFNGGYYGSYQNAPYQVAMHAKFEVQGGACFDAPPIPCLLNDHGRFHWLDGTFRYTAVGAGERLGGRMSSTFAVTLDRAQYALPGMPWIDGTGLGKWECLSGVKRTWVGQATFSKDGAGVITLTMDVSNIFVGDTLFTEANRAVSDHNSGTTALSYFVVGHVASINTGAGTCVLSGGSVDIPNGDVLHLYAVSYPTIRRPRQAAMTSGSPTLTDAGITTKEWTVGMPVQGIGIPAHARVAAVAAGSITMTKNATSTRTSDIYDGLFMPTMLTGIQAPTAGNYAAGSVVRNTLPSVDGNNMVIEGWLCTVGGSPGTWVPLRNSTVSPAT